MNRKKTCNFTLNIKNITDKDAKQLLNDITEKDAKVEVDCILENTYYAADAYTDTLFALVKDEKVDITKNIPKRYVEVSLEDTREGFISKDKKNKLVLINIEEIKSGKKYTQHKPQKYIDNTIEGATQ